jgi:hypothetical protein
LISKTKVLHQNFLFAFNYSWNNFQLSNNDNFGKFVLTKPRCINKGFRSKWPDVCTGFR